LEFVCAIAPFDEDVSVGVELRDMRTDAPLFLLPGDVVVSLCMPPLGEPFVPVPDRPAEDGVLSLSGLSEFGCANAGAVANAKIVAAVIESLIIAPGSSLLGEWQRQERDRVPMDLQTVWF
jgi:hypothetical protein